MKKDWLKAHMCLSKDGLQAKKLVGRICNALSKAGNRKFFASVDIYDGACEGHIFDTGKCVEDSDGRFKLSELPNAQEIGMVFWGGHFYFNQRKDAASQAWISLLEDCIGNSENGQLSAEHNLTDHLKDFGPLIDFNCHSIESLEKILESYECK